MDNKRNYCIPVITHYEMHDFVLDVIYTSGYTDDEARAKEDILFYEFEEEDEGEQNLNL